MVKNFNVCHMPRDVLLLHVPVSTKKAMVLLIKFKWFSMSLTYRSNHVNGAALLYNANTLTGTTDLGPHGGLHVVRWTCSFEDLNIVEASATFCDACQQTGLFFMGLYMTT